MSEVEPGGTAEKISGTAMFAAELKAYRSHRGWTQVQLGEKIGYSDSYISDVEREMRLPTAQLAERCDEAFGTPGTFKRWQEVAKQNIYPAFFAPVIPYEAKASRIDGWELGAIPGLLQTEAYAHAQISAAKPTDSHAAIERLVSARMERQEILNREDPPLCWHVVDESAFRRIVGNSAIMSAQIDKLVTLTDDPRIIIQVLPFKGGIGMGADGRMTIFEFPDSQPMVGYSECYRGGRLMEDKAEVSEMATQLNLIRASAISPLASVEWMRQVRSELDER